tara:strand:+ start:999 stop:1544 length:546 start_codon:yes stop_codon:yes gene_type:complete
MVDIPFVSENFQRSYRNRFPSQTSTGRDLHVSDVIIPVVDFTPTASGTSLPINLRQARSTATGFVQEFSSVTEQDLITDTGFFNVFVNAQLSADELNGQWNIKLTNGTVNKQVAGSYMLLGATTDGHVNTNEEFIIYVPETYKATYTLEEPAGSSAMITIYHTQVADVNGNETLPPLYSPQ